MKHPLVELINKATETSVAAKEAPFRNHLGGSLIGRPCDRQLWYAFRWAYKEKFDGRMLRLFARGQREEYQFIAHLRNVGVHVTEVDPVTGKQYVIQDIDGHFGGSLDGIAKYEQEDVLVEFKTHNTKSFCSLVASGSVKETKIEHWRQMQIYMHKRQLVRGIYMAVNKNDDDLYIETVEYDPEEGPRLLERARKIIHSPKPLERIGKHPSWFECKMCPAVRICHYGEDMLRNCRTCRFSRPVEDGQWHCDKWQAKIPGDVVPKGCESYLVITD